MVKFDVRAVWEGVVDTSEESFLHQLVGSWRASIRCLGALNLVAGLTESDHARLSVEKALTAVVLSPLGVQSLSSFLTALSYGYLVG